MKLDDLRRWNYLFVLIQNLWIIELFKIVVKVKVTHNLGEQVSRNTQDPDKLPAMQVNQHLVMVVY